MSRRNRRTVAIDFDGVIHQYSKGWRDGTIYDPPVEGAREAMEKLHRRYDIVIFTTRVNPAMRGADTQIDEIIGWLERYGFRRGEHYDDITHAKPAALVYIDDRALHFTDWDLALEEFATRYPLDR